VFHELVETADAVCSNLRGDVPEKLGLTYAHLKRWNPQIVCAHLSAYGRAGPRANWPGYDYLMQAEAGFLSLTGEPGSPPARFGLSVVDFMTGLGLAYAVLAGLTGVRASGRGQDMDVSLFDFALSTTNYLATWYLNKGESQQRLPRSAHPSLVPCQLYRTGDGWIFIMCNKEKFWVALCDALGRSWRGRAACSHSLIRPMAPTGWLPTLFEAARVRLRPIRRQVWASTPTIFWTSWATAKSVSTGCAIKA
jgi:crotonobetainyl-CoA:carnitine CoA-transferase CaiB-like acyl-CoA transferase